ncbi:peptidoglycan DD-metalloendopeptidase family protein [Martelella mediterranea]|uniref:Murein DD-endopeptidase MepM/ murein hydrolase activator NlpD n=1 Tax=Martelella mediterranea TaxID=293089 RepID=A0A4R3NKD8_9HYPH|nr:LysM peptidoglycan-binding domain-containing protein [Martelella mediterranea]TCT34822.1 murein DD-endopeptidase MepM/ murein hydrolase activator NlpD [Martelella mediterranea]
MRISGMPEVGKATQGFLLVSALAIMAAGCTSQSARIASSPDSMTTGSVAPSTGYQNMVPPANVGSGGYQGLPSQSSGQAVVSRQPISTATTAGSGARMATTPVSVQSNNLPVPSQSQQTAALAQPANPATTYSNTQAVVGQPSALPSQSSDANAKRVVMRSDETLSEFARRNGVSEQDILRANGLTSTSQVRPGQVLYVPLVSGQSSAAQTAAQTPGLTPGAPAPAPQKQSDNRVAVLPSTPSTRDRESSRSASSASSRNGDTGAGSAKPQTASSGSEYTVKSGDSLYKIAQANGVSVDALKQANGLTTANIRIGQQLVIPTAGSVPAEPAAKVQTAELDTSAKPQPQKQASATSGSQNGSSAGNPEPYQPPIAESKEAVVEEVSVRSDAGEAVPEGTGITTYRWPVNGAIVVGYGQADGDEISEGIDISVPQGTPIKAAENGVVVYADDGLTDYGNAILVRHDDGRVTVYGYAEELKVKRGDRVQRGQTIAVSGMTGKASRPMVHFEVRENTKAVDPMPYLNG